MEFSVTVYFDDFQAAHDFVCVIPMINPAVTSISDVEEV